MNLPIAILTISDTRGATDDRSGDYLATAVQDAGHRLAARAWVRDDAADLRARLQTWIDDPAIAVIVTTGGTGVTGRDVTPEVAEALFTKPVPGFGELFRQLSYADIGAATIQSRATAGVAGNTLLFCLPGSTGACRLGWEKILAPQLDERTKPCNFAMLLPRLTE